MRANIWIERAEKLEAFDGKGMTAAQVARQVGLTTLTVHRYANKFGFDFGAPCSGLDGDQKYAARIERIREFAAKGVSRVETAKQMGLSAHTVGNLARSNGIKFVRPDIGVRDEQRVSAMAAMYKGGKTLEEIGGLYGVTRERVRQLIKKHSGLTGPDGGQATIAQRKREAAKAKRDARCFEKHGCIHEQYMSLLNMGKSFMKKGGTREKSPVGAFARQQNTAKQRGIEWSLKLWDWWQIWQQSGKWAERGRGKGKYVMCRFGDVGAYEAGNVYIARFEHNVLFQPNNPYRKGHPDHEKVMKPIREKLRDRARRDRPEVGSHGLPVGVYRRGSKYLAQLSISGKVKYLGTFATVQSAEEEVLRALADITGRIAA